MLWLWGAILVPKGGEGMEGKSTILGGAMLLTGANLLLRVISIAFNVFLTGRIGAAGLGLLQLISTVSIFAALIGSSGVRVAAMNLTAEEYGHRRLGGVRAAMSACLRYGLLISSVVGLATFFLADYFATSWLCDARATLSIRCVGLLLPFSCLCGVMTGYFTACARIRSLVIIEIAERLASMALTAVLLLTWARNDLSRACFSIVFGSSVGAAFDFFLLYWMYRRDLCHVRAARDGSMRKRLVRLCVPLALNDYLRSGLNTAEQLLIPYGLARYAGSGTQGMAAYGTIHAMVFPVLMFPAAVLFSLTDLLVPEFSRARAMGRRLRVADLTEKCLRLCMLFAAGAAGVLFVCADELGMWLYQSAQAGQYLRIFAPMVLMLYLDAIVDGMLKGLAEQVSCVRYNTATSLLDVLLLLLLLPRWGIAGYVFSFAVTHGINLYLSLRRLLKVSRHRVKWRTLCTPVFCLCFAVPLSAIAPSGLPRAILFAALLCACFCLCDAFPQRDRLWLSQVLRASFGKNSERTKVAASRRRESGMSRR